MGDFDFYVDPDGNLEKLRQMIRADKRNEMTYGDIFEEFIRETHVDKQVIDDYRPCCEMFGVPDIANAIVVWLRNGAKIIYISHSVPKI